MSETSHVPIIPALTQLLQEAEPQEKGPLINAIANLRMIAVQLATVTRYLDETLETVDWSKRGTPEANLALLKMAANCEELALAGFSETLLTLINR